MTAVPGFKISRDCSPRPPARPCFASMPWVDRKPSWAALAALAALIRSGFPSETEARRADNEIKKVFDNQEIKDIFDKIDKKLQGNQELRNFKKVIEKDKTLIAKLTNYNEFRKEVWYSFLKQVEPGVSSLVENYNTKKPDIEAIVAVANGSKGLWDDTIEEFKTRFTSLPFSFDIKDRGDAILGKSA